MLHRVNFLPWREVQRKKYKQGFITALLFCIASAVGVQFSIGWYVAEAQLSQKKRLTELDGHVSKLDHDITQLSSIEQKHKALLTRLQAVEYLYHQRNKTTQILNDLPSLVPEGIYLDTVQMDANQITLNGISDTTARLAALLNNLERSTAVRGVEIHSIIHDKQRFGRRYQSFDVSFFIRSQAEQKR